MSLQTVVYVLIGIIMSTAVCHSQKILNVSCCSRNNLPNHSCPPSNQLSLDIVLGKFQNLPPDSVLQLTNGTCKQIHPLIFTGVSNITIRRQGYHISTLTSPATTKMLNWFSTNLFAYNFMTFLSILVE